MELSHFEQSAASQWERIPTFFKEGVQAVIVHHERKEDPLYEGVFLMGECEADPATSMVPDVPLRSIIHLYHGSFQAIADREEAFDWQEELWETLTHELRHHLEWRAGVDHLGDEDDLEKENFARRQGLAFDPDFHRRGVRLDEGVTSVGGDLFLEVVIEPEQWRAALSAAMDITWGDLTCHLPALPELRPGVHFIHPELSLDDPRQGSARGAAAAPGDPQEDSPRLPWQEVVVVLRGAQPSLKKAWGRALRSWQVSWSKWRGDDKPS